MLSRIAAVAAAILALASAAQAAELRPAVTVAGTAVTLGDLFDDAGAAAGVAVANAPAPGLRTEISVSRISLAARRNGIEWRNDAGLTHVVVARSGLAVPDEDVAAAIAAAVETRSTALPSAAVLQVDFTNGMAGIQVAETAEPTVSVEQISYNTRSGAFTAIVRAPAGDMLSPLRRVTGRAYAVLDVPVLTRDMQPGDVVRQQDIDWVRLPANRVSQNMIASLDHLVGMSPRRPARAGEPLRQSDMSPPIVVDKGAQVDVTLVSGSLTLTARGRALQSGAVGDIVNVLNTRSNRTLQGVVTGPNMVTIDTPGAAHAASAARAADNS
ncbi:MAG: flagellar basal body P-ring formation chaperone FlgA [Parvibaculum sp.]|uniref:flagellar basal body P-ring formation chaperone FlgA n=1 Tax=Parvibaculum sp. TaxID=2024848 RepID=UPI00273177EC|nr:flagellar basal body P-ring formation chaperone FlgA [Parvibaculum sp.]MDP1627107.1 flagellar basal body P-ring formation chaperone FlgA [Parvibaculum sp.]MDP2149302.1 flagellar basal body P-ring formation chaperone FlgA [Parvibaculum sp.]